MKCLICRNFVTVHAFLTGWHLFTFFTVATFLCTPSVILDFCFILVASNTVIWASLFDAHRFKHWKSRILFSMLQYSPEKLSKLWDENSCLAFCKKCSGLYFSNFVLVQHIVAQKLVKTKSSHWRCSLRKGILRNFAKPTRKHLCQSLYFNKLKARPATLLKQ